MPLFHLMGKNVRVTFDPDLWPVPYGRYTFNGEDDNGYWVTRPDGYQRYLDKRVVKEIKEV